MKPCLTQGDAPLPRRLPRVLLLGLPALAALACTAPAGDGAQVPETPQPPPQLEVVSSPDAPEAIGPYSQAIRVGHTVYLAGQIGLDPRTGEMVEGGIEAETRQVMANLEAVLAAAGLGFQHVAMTQVFLADVEEFGAMNEVYAAHFGEAPPARATVEVSRLPRDARVEIQMTAVGPSP